MKHAHSSSTPYFHTRFPFDCDGQDQPRQHLRPLGALSPPPPPTLAGLSPVRRARTARRNCCAGRGRPSLSGCCQCPWSCASHAQSPAHEGYMYKQKCCGFGRQMTVKVRKGTVCFHRKRRRRVSGDRFSLRLNRIKREEGRGGEVFSRKAPCRAKLSGWFLFRLQLKRFLNMDSTDGRRGKATRRWGQNTRHRRAPLPMRSFSPLHENIETPRYYNPSPIKNSLY